MRVGRVLVGLVAVLLLAAGCGDDDDGPGGLGDSGSDSGDGVVACDLLSAEEFEEVGGDPITSAEAFGSEDSCGYDTEEVQEVHGNLLVFSTEFVDCETLLPLMEDPEPVDGVGDFAEVDYDESASITEARLNVCTEGFAISFSVIGAGDHEDLRDVAVELTRMVIDRLP